MAKLVRDDEEQLIACSQHGDVNAFNELILRYQQMTYGAVLRMLGDADAAADITQDAFIAAFRGIYSFTGGCSMTCTSTGNFYRVITVYLLMEIETNWSTGVPKHDDRHLTTTQLSALIDKQLSAQELALCKAHLQSCQQCQSALAGLQQTVALLQAMPEPALPRSFALPAGVTYLQERPARHGQDEGEQPAITNPPVRRRSWPQ